ncbi:MAG: hypothetical protein JNM63_09290 [Spirochaetia bacterium]|nr:hypothetical protein [Spirochaetia bacterium]
MVRFQGADIFLASGIKNDFEFNPVNLDRFYYLIHRLKSEGIYLSLDLWSYGGYLQGEWNEAHRRRLPELMLVDPAPRVLWESGVRRLMSCRNPYTGTKIAEENAIALVTMYNEQDIPVMISMFDDPKVKPAATQRWREFLTRRYGGISGLENAWGEKFPAGTAIDELPLFVKKNASERSAKGSDIGVFILECERDLLRWYQKTLRAAGYTGLTTQLDAIKLYREIAARNENPVITMHAYHNHPTDIRDARGSRMGQDGAVETTANYFRSQATTRYLNRPMAITEYNMMYWHRYRHEEGIVFPAYSAFQDFSAIAVHSMPVILRATKPLVSGRTGNDPVHRASQVMAALLFKRGDVSTSAHTVALAVSDAYLTTNGNLNFAVNSDQSKIALLCRFGVRLDRASPDGLPPYPKADMNIAPADGATLVATEWAASVIDTAGGEDLDALILAMKKRGVLSPDNRSSAAGGIFQNDTREILMDVHNRRMTVVTPRFEGAILKEDQSAALSTVLNLSTTAAAAIAVASLEDAQTLATSDRFLIVYSTDALNTGFEASEDRVTIIDNGTVPVLMRTGILKIDMKIKNPKGKSLWALGFDGRRREKIPFALSEGNALHLTFDTSALKNGPTPFFELAGE